MEKIKYLFCFIIICIFFAGCGSEDLPIERLKKNLKDVDTYSIILEDMKEEGLVSKTYFHQYRVVTPQDGYVTPWLKVSEKYYSLNSGFLGMALVDKKDGKLDSDPAPPGYRYVGDSNYGEWRTDSSGNSFWEFYGKYALLSHLMGSWYRPVYMHDYRSYQDYSRRNMVYYGNRNYNDRDRASTSATSSTRSYGSQNIYGTNGDVSKQSKPSFYERRKEKQQTFKQQFKSNLNKKVGRTKSGVSRGRAGRVGK